MQLSQEAQRALALLSAAVRENNPLPNRAACWQLVAAPGGLLHSALEEISWQRYRPTPQGHIVSRLYLNKMLPKQLAVFCDMAARALARLTLAKADRSDDASVLVVCRELLATSQTLFPTDGTLPETLEGIRDKIYSIRGKK